LIAAGKLEIIFVESKKPNYETGTAVKLSFGSSPAEETTSAKASGDVWTVDDIDDSIDLVDEDALLEEEDLIVTKVPTADDCGTSATGKAKACKNCTCGRAEMEEEPAPSATPVSSATVKSACGNCYLGDAFRCPGCPSRGLPAFKPGEVVSLKLDAL